MKQFFLLIMLAAVLLSGYAGWRWIKFSSSPSSARSALYVLDVPPGSNFRTVVTQLERDKIIEDPLVFRLYAKFAGLDKQMKVGEYAIAPNESALAILSKLISGKSIEYRFTVPEGTNMYEIATIFELQKLMPADEALKLFTDRAFVKSLLKEDLPSLEGYLFPETYTYTKYTEARDIVKSMVRLFLKNWEHVSKSPTHPLSRHKAVTFASIVEKETGVKEERGLVASVFHNRLKKGMKLQTDPTIMYGILHETGRPTLNIRKADLLRPTAYNTYVIPALPPGPIGNPGRDALYAALHPEPSPYLFFVSRNDGTHVFTETYENHSAAVKSFQLNPKARAGKSWRDRLNKPAGAQK